MGNRIKKNDQVLILSGREKGKRGRVLSVDPGKAIAVVENVNFVKRHTKANPQKNIKGGILEKEASLPLSKLMGICKECQEPTRFSFQTREGRKMRVCKKCDAAQD
ncbi:MAG: 50S ribosomal protein L24 [Acidobacteria bacterium 37-65-4]|nr:MAG: 50S ribosomal protein L24 [Acidobacteria bacterium 37-65-4]